MKDLFGNEVENIIEKKAFSPYQKFKAEYHYREAEREKKCGNCPNHKRYEYHERYYHKCLIMGISMSESTDIRIRNVCDIWGIPRNGE